MKIKTYVHMRLNGCVSEETHELPEDWESMSEDEKEKALEIYATGTLENEVDYGAYLVDE